MRDENSNRRVAGIPGDTQPNRTPIADPASQPRHALTGRQQRGNTIYGEYAGVATDDLSYWEVEVTPLEGASAAGRGFDAPEQLKRGVVFEVRARYNGTGLAAFGSQPNTRMLPQSWEEDQGLAMAIARRWTEILRSGARDVDLLQVATEVKARRD